MVKQGPFTAELVYADTKIPFKEHTSPSTGQVYVEVEPDAEYFIRVRSEYPATVVTRYSVDGKKLDHQRPMHQGDVKDNGLWSFDGTSDIMKALVFVKTPVHTQGDISGAPPYWTGEVEVSFFEATQDGTVHRQAHTSSWAGGDVGYMIGAMDPSKKKGLKSTKGEYKEVNQHTSGPTVNYRVGPKLDTITLKYCSTIGLIHAGILPKPPAWDLHRMMYPATSAPGVQNGDVNVDLSND